MQNSLAPWLSVIIPIYNAEKYLRKCLSSVKAQTFTDFEVLLIDDGSTDKSADICKEFSEKDNRFRYFKKKTGERIKQESTAPKNRSANILRFAITTIII